MEVVGFPLCCGAVVLHSFGHTGCTEQTDGDMSPTKTKVKAFLNKTKKEYKHLSFLIAILNAHQNKELEKVFKACGFEEMANSLNINHGNDCILYVYNNKNKLTPWR